ncbi:MAG TPA: DoxX family membrane protein [Thermoanaerobaculia bacterium]|nr:DoxX family membrane protein [Thermoanaerobaculia bacterium]
MAPLIVLAAATLLARLAGRLGVASLRDWQAATRVGLAVMFLFTAAAHFNRMQPDMVRMVPPSVPNAELMVTITGICEGLGAIGLLVPRTRRVAAIALIILLLAVLPANIHAAQSGVTIGGAAATPLVPRIALQLFFIALLWWSAMRPPGHDRAAERSGV